MRVLTYTGLTVSLAQELQVGALLRGVRSSTDMEYERTLADLNRHIADMENGTSPSLPSASPQHQLNCCTRAPTLWRGCVSLPTRTVFSLDVSPMV